VETRTGKQPVGGPVQRRPRAKAAPFFGGCLALTPAARCGATGEKLDITDAVSNAGTLIPVWGTWPKCKAARPVAYIHCPVSPVYPTPLVSVGYLPFAVLPRIELVYSSPVLLAICFPSSSHSVVSGGCDPRHRSLLSPRVLMQR
jgi:hypothetical protein